MDQYCRLCLKEDFKDVFISFSHILSDSSSVLDSYKLLTYINFEDQEDLDNSKICEECCFKLSSFNDFRNLAINNNDYIINLKLQGI